MAGLVDTIRKTLDERLEKDKKKVEEDLEEIETEDLEEEYDKDKKKSVKKEKEEEEEEMDDEKDDKKKPSDSKDDKKKKDDDEEVDVKESLKKIFAKVEVSDEIKEELSVLFSAAVSQHVETIKEDLEKENEQQVEAFITEQEENIDKYISYVAKEWLDENKVEVEAGIKVEVADNLIGGLKTLFEDNYVEVPESKVDLIEEAEHSIDKLIESLDEVKNENMALQEEIDTMKAENIVNELTNDLTETQKDKLNSLIDSIDYEDDDSYKNKVQIVIENYFNKDVKEDDKKLDEEVKRDKDTGVSQYAEFMRKNK